MTLPPSQRPREIAAFLDLLVARKVRTYLEVGARNGLTFEAVGNVLEAPSVLVAVDLPGALWGRDNSWAHLEAAAERLRARGHTVYLINGNSHDPRTADNVREIQDTFDAVFIDGDHRYQGVKADWEAYGPMGALVAFHDIKPGPNNDRVQVPRLWAPLAAQYAHLEIYDPDAPGMGIGVLFPRDMQ